MSATIKVFQASGKCYSHVMNGSHDSVELRGQKNEILLTFGANAKVSNKDGLVGIFIVEYIDGQPRWVYYESPHQLRTVFGPDLHTAEVEVSRRFISRLDYFPGENSAVTRPAFLLAMGAPA